MVKLEEWMDTRVLRKEGRSIKAIARLTGRSRNTVRRALREAGPRAFNRPTRHSCVDAFRQYLRERFEACGLSAVRLHGEIKAMGFAGSLVTVRRYLQSLKPEQERLRKLTVRFETPPGKQAQADWGDCGRFADACGTLTPVYVSIGSSGSGEGVDDIEGIHLGRARKVLRVEPCDTCLQAGGQQHRVPESDPLF
jgi:hypothetical protein